MTPTQQLIRDEVLRRLAAGESLRAICRDEGFPTEAAVRQWAQAPDADPEGFPSRYTRARAMGYERMADELLEISDDSTSDTVYTETGEKADNEWIQRSKLRVDTRKWLLSKMLPKTYGDKVAVEASGPDGGPIRHAATVAVSIDPVAASQTYKQLMDDGAA